MFAPEPLDLTEDSDTISRVIFNTIGDSLCCSGWDGKVGCEFVDVSDGQSSRHGFGLFRRCICGRGLLKSDKLRFSLMIRC